MSLTTLISNQYRDYADLSEKVNKSILVLKKEHYLANPDFKREHRKMLVSLDELENARIILFNFLTDIEQSYNNSGYFDDEFINTLNSKVLTKGKIINTKESINKNQILTEGQLKILDTLLLTIDNRRTTLFRKLRN